MRFKPSFTVLLFLVVSSILVSCAGNLSVERTYAEPEEVDQGNDLTMYVVLNGPKDKVDRVVGTVREYTEMRAVFNNDGTEGDQVANDNIWTHQFPVPWDAPNGTYHIDISVYDQNGKEIVTEGFENQWTGKSGTIEVSIQ